MQSNQNKVGILGTGDVAKSLGAGFLSLGYEVMLGSRDSRHEGASAWAKTQGSRACVGTFAEAADFGHILVLATLWSGTEHAISLMNPKRASGKVVLDVTNPLVFHPAGPPTLAVGHTSSGGELVQSWLPDAFVVKVFNTVGHAHMVHPSFAGQVPDMFFAGDDAISKQTVADLCRHFGWNPVDLGSIEAARLLEPLCILWVTYGIRTSSWNHVFTLLKK